MPYPTIELRSTRYLPDGSSFAVETALLEIEEHAMNMSIDLGDEALSNGNPPVGAVLIDKDRGLVWGATTIDKTVPHILGHAEIRAYSNEAQRVVGNQLQNCTLVSTAQLCNTCTSPYAEGKIGKIIYAAPRWAIYAVCGLMRPRQINMHDLLVDGDIDTVVTEGYHAERVLASFALWGELKRRGKVRM